MSLHNRLVAKALENGDTADVFTHAAQRKANATWIYIIIAGVIWYFVDWKWALIPAAFAVLSAIQSVSATRIADTLDKINSEI